MGLSFSQSRHSIYFGPAFTSLEEALKACTHLGIGAHQDDLEVMAAHGILECFEKNDQAFVGVTCTDGGGSARSGQYAKFDDEQMRDVRVQEQLQSAKIGQFQSMLQLGFPSSDIKASWNMLLLNELKAILIATQPQFIYTHNLVDKHLTHVAVVSHLVRALRELNFQPQAFYGCEVWRSLDWLSDGEKIPLAISNTDLVKKMIACHHSQTQGGKAYDEASLGRMRANATYFQSHQVDQTQNIWFAMNLLPLLENTELSVKDFINSHIEKLKFEVNEFLQNFK